jgi:methyl-accepting chemotaxis protein
MKDRLYDGVASLDDTLQEMSTLAREVQRISRATHLLALNASVEATRASHSGEGFAVVAQEVRRLAGDARRAGMRLGDHVDAMQKRLRDLKKDVRRHDTEDDEIVLQAEENARAVLRALLGSTAEASRAAAALQQGSRAVQDDLERILMNLQSQDRLSQMLNAVTDDMGRLHDWLAGTDDPVARVPARWLERLEQSYTMEEQRSSHHDTVVIDKQAAVEFF